MPMTPSNGAQGSASPPSATPYRPQASLKGRTVLMSGGSRGIGLAIALRAAQDGANIALLAKTAQPHATLDGTVFTAAALVEEAGGRALPLVGDVRKDDDVAQAVAAAVRRFGGLDVVINNASAIDLSPTPDVDMKRYDLMQDVNVRGTFLLSKLALPALLASGDGQILTLSPPLNLDPAWAGRHLAYTMAKYGMSITTLGLAEEFRDRPLTVNSLWPCTLIDTAAIRKMPDGNRLAQAARSPAIMADAAHAILVGAHAPPGARRESGRFYTDEEVLTAAGVSDFTAYSLGAAEDRLVRDIFLDTPPGPSR